VKPKPRFLFSPKVNRVRWFLGILLAASVIAFLSFGVTRLLFRSSQAARSSDIDSAPELVLQTGHGSRINCAVFSPDHRWLASGSADNTIKLWDVESGRELRTLNGHKNWIKTLAVSRNGEMLASGSNDHTVKLWDVSSGREVKTLRGHQSPVEVVVFSPDGHWVISGSTDKSIKVWDAASGNEVQTLKGHTAGITALAVSGDGKILASGGSDNQIMLWSTLNWNPLRTLNKNLKTITTLRFSPSGQLLLSGSADGSLMLWDVANGRNRVTTKHSSAAVLHAAFVTEEQFLSSSADNTVAWWDTSSGRLKRIVAGDDEVGETLFASLSQDGTLVASSMGKRSMEIRDTRDGKHVRTLTSHSVSFFSVAFSRDGRWMACGTDDRTIRLWQTATGREMPKLVGHTGWVKAVAFSPDSHLLASASNSGEVKLWDVSTGRETYSQSHPEILHAIAFSSDGKWLAAAGTGKAVYLLELNTKRALTLTGHSGEITSIAFVPNSMLIASGSTDKTVRLWDLSTGVVVKTFVEFTDQVNAIAVSPNGETLAAGTADNKIHLFRVSSADTSAERTMSGHTGEVFALSFSLDGRWLASGSKDETVKLWDPSSGAEIRTLTGASGDVNAIAFTNDSQSLISANGGGSVMVWKLESGTLGAVLVSMPQSDDWLVATPSGLFDGSHTAWKLLLWRFAHSTFKVSPVESFFNEFYYPGLLADVLANKNIKAQQNIQRKDRRQPRLHLECAEASASGNIADRIIHLKVEVSEAPADADYKDGSGARDVRLFRNGLLVRVWSGDVLRGLANRTVEIVVPIVAGENDFTAYAFNRDNIKSADSELLISGSDKLQRQGTAYLVVVGVGRYGNSQYNLNYSTADATEFGTELKSQQDLLRQYNPVEVISLLNEDATKENILLALRLLAGTVTNPIKKDVPADLLKIKAAQPEDAVIFYFSGHGAATEDRFYLIPHDLGYQGLRSELDEAGLTTILTHSISDLELEEALKPLDADQLLLVIDACNSGQILKADDERRGPMNARGLAQLAYEKGMYVLTAAQSDEVAFESAGLKHSYLAYALLEEGIKSGAADKDHNGRVLLNEWFDYATDRVPRIRGQKRQLGKQLEEMEPDERRVQRPRVFNMREGGAERFVVARVAGDK
jgi:WD40 repeat protein/uncharacterized caspase-like protein